MIRMKNAAVVAALTLALGLCLSQPALALGGEKVAKAGDPIDFDPHAAHGGDGESLFWVNQADGAKGVKKVIIPFFQIQFVTDSQASATGAGGAHSKMAMKLNGPTPDQMQAITNEIYAAYVADLQAAGLEVVTLEQTKTYAAFNDIMANSKPSGTTIKGMNGVTSNFYAPTGMNFYFLPTMLPELAGGDSMTAMSNTQNIRREAALMEQSGAAVAGFRAVVDFATVEASDRRGFRALARNAKTKGEAGLVIRPLGTQMFLITPNAKATMTDPQNRMRIELQTPLMIDSDAIKAMDDTTTSAQKTGEALGNAISFMAGVGGSKSKAFEVNVDKDVWQKDITGALKGVSAAVTAKLKAGL